MSTEDVRLVNQNIDWEEAAKNDYADVPVPMDARKSWKPISLVWFGAAMFVGLYYAGVELGTAMGTLGNTMLAILFGAAFLLMMVILNGNIGTKTGCVTSVASTYAYGSKGVFIPAFWIVEFGWYVVMISQFTIVIEGMFPIVDYHVLSIILCLLFVTNGYHGFDQLARLNRIAMPILLIGGLYGVIRAAIITEGGLGTLFSQSYDNTITLAAGITIVIGTWASGSSRAADYFRFSRSTKDTIIATSIGFFTGLVVCLVIGAIWGASTMSNTIAGAATTLGGGMVVVALIMFFMQTWTTNEHSAYVQSTGYPLAIKVLTGKRVERRSVVAVIAVLAIITSSFDYTTMFLPFLNLIGIFVPAVGGVLFGDFYIMARTNYHWTGHKNFYMNYYVNSEDVQHHKFNPSVIPALVCGTLAGGFIPFGVGALNAMLGSVIVYCLSCLILAPLRKKEMAKNEALANEKGAN